MLHFRAMLHFHTMRHLRAMPHAWRLKRWRIARRRQNRSWSLAGALRSGYVVGTVLTVGSLALLIDVCGDDLNHPRALPDALCVNYWLVAADDPVGMMQQDHFRVELPNGKRHPFSAAWIEQDQPLARAEPLHGPRSVWIEGRVDMLVGNARQGSKRHRERLARDSPPARDTVDVNGTDAHARPPVKRAEEELIVDLDGSGADGSAQDRPFAFDVEDVLQPHLERRILQGERLVAPRGRCLGQKRAQYAEPEAGDVAHMKAGHRGQAQHLVTVAARQLGPERITDRVDLFILVHEASLPIASRA
mmetsp:Transcript_4788/g.19192  ORF Transcript_4788/g.19192 Transcript_4788/m.19192 type:complete len:304 (-) Transcript_4788:1280-2191(-)